MSDEPRKASEAKAPGDWGCLAVLLTSLAILTSLFMWFASRPEKLDPRHALVAVRLISLDKAAQIAIAEVKRREGWAGKSDEPSREDTFFYVAVRRKLGPTSDWRYLTIEGETGKVLYYNARTDRLD
jgi:hypothetical protein